MTSRFADHILGPGDHASRPSAATTPEGALYACTDHGLIYQVQAGAWATWATVDATARSEYLTVAASDESTDLTTGTAKVTFRMPYAMTLTGVRASLSVTSSSGNVVVDVNEGGATVLSTKITVEAGDTSSLDAATPPVISDAALADDAVITVDIDSAGTDAAGLKVTLIGTRA